LGEFSVNCRNCLKGRKTVCEFEVPGQEVWELNGERYTGCPFMIVTRQSAGYLKAFVFYKNGYLPNPGTWLDQPAKLLDALEIIEKELRDMEAEYMKRTGK
jgi:hypothetical protein